MRLLTLYLLTLAPWIGAQEVSFETESGTIVHSYQEFELRDVTPHELGTKTDTDLPPEFTATLRERARATHSDAVILLRDRELVFEYATERGRDPIEIMSVTKAVVGLSIGRLLQLGRLSSVDEPVHRLYPEWRQGRKQRITVKHLLAHASGLESTPGAQAVYHQPDVVQFALASELAADPGTEFFYNNEAVNLLAGIVERISKRKLDAFLAEEVFRKLGVARFSWLRDPVGNPHVMAGLRMTAIDLARIGQLMLDGGKIGKEQIIDPKWCRESVVAAFPQLHPRVGMSWFVLTGEPGREGEPGDPIGFQANGHLGQYLLVVPRLRLVAVRLIDQSSHTEKDHSFPDFMDRIRELNRTL